MRYKKLCSLRQKKHSNFNANSVAKKLLIQQKMKLNFIIFIGIQKETRTNFHKKSTAQK